MSAWFATAPDARRVRNRTDGRFVRAADHYDGGAGRVCGGLAHLKGPIGMPKPAMTLSIMYGSAPRSTSMHAACRPQYQTLIPDTMEADGEAVLSGDVYAQGLRGLMVSDTQTQT